MQQAKITVSGVSRNREGTTRLETVNAGTFTEKNGFCYVRTPYLTIPLETKTKKVRVKKLPYGWKLKMEYDLAYAATDVNRIITTIIVDLRE